MSAGLDGEDEGLWVVSDDELVRVRLFGVDYLQYRRPHSNVTGDTDSDK
jgi:hypothetical protein